MIYDVTRLTHKRISQTGKAPSHIEVHEEYIIESSRFRAAIDVYVTHVLKYIVWLESSTPHMVVEVRTLIEDGTTDVSGRASERQYHVMEIKKDLEKVAADIRRAVRR